MEKFSQYRDRGSGISPFMPIKTPSTAGSVLVRVFIFAARLFVFLPYVATYFLVLQHLPMHPALRKLLLWCLLGIPGIWWVDLQLDGVKRGHLSQAPPTRVPHPGSVIAANFTSPIDAIYLAAVFDPIFTVSYPHTRKVRRVSLLSAALGALRPARLAPDGHDGRSSAAAAAGLTDLRALLDAHPDRVIAVFPECATTNGQGILPFSPSLLAVPARAKIFPVSMRYTPPDVTTPVPGAWAAFLWKLLSRPTHCVRVRIAEGMANTSNATNGVSGLTGKTVGSDDDDDDDATGSSGDDGQGSDVTPEEQVVLDRIGEALARLGRNKRVGLTLRDKEAFVKAWKKSSK